MTAHQHTFGSPSGEPKHYNQTDASANVRKTLDTTSKSQTSAADCRT